MNGNDEILNDGDAQMALGYIEGDTTDASGFIDDVDYVQALEVVDAALEKLTAVRKYLEGKTN